MDIEAQKKKYTNPNNGNNVISNNPNNVTNDNKDISSYLKKYALDRSVFTPNTEETQLAEKIAVSFTDLNNYAFYLKVVNKLGISRSYSFWKSHQEEEEEKKGTRYEFRSSKRYFAYKFKKKVILENNEKVTK